VTRLLSRMRRAVVVAGLLAAVAAGAAAFVISGLNKPSQPSLSPFIRQTDGKFGYVMLRPAAWTAVDGRDIGRVYRDGTNVADTRVILTVRNIAASHLEGDMDPMIFSEHPTLGGWTASWEQSWRHDHVEFVLLQSLPNARIYATRLTGTSMDGDTVQRLILVAYVVDQGQPLKVGLEGSATGGSLPSLAELRANGAIEGFIAMVRSLSAIPVDPGNVSPPLD
jgi:hypothetical protein